MTVLDAARQLKASGAELYPGSSEYYEAELRLFG